MKASILWILLRRGFLARSLQRARFTTMPGPLRLSVCEYRVLADATRNPDLESEREVLNFSGKGPRAIG